MKPQQHSRVRRLLSALSQTTKPTRPFRQARIEVTRDAGTHLETKVAVVFHVLTKSRNALKINTTAHDISRAQSRCVRACASVCVCVPANVTCAPGFSQLRYRSPQYAKALKDARRIPRRSEAILDATHMGPRSRTRSRSRKRDRER